MTTIPQAMTWEFLRRGGWGFVAAPLAAMAVPAFLLGTLRIEAHDQSLSSLHFVLTLCQQLGFTIVAFQAHGKASRLFAWPIRTPTLVLWQLLPGMAALFAMTVVTTGFVNWQFGVGWPVWGPALFFAASWTAYQSVVWLTVDRPFRMIFVLTVVAVGLGLWFKERYGGGFADPQRLWLDVTASEWATMGAVVLLAYSAGVVGVARARRGDTNRTSPLVEWIEGLDDSPHVAGRGFRSADRALFWSEWHVKGLLMPGCLVAMSVVGLGLWLWNGSPTGEVREALFALGAFIPVGGAVFGLVFGSAGPDDGRPEMGPFLASRPVSDVSLAYSRLRAAGLSLLVTWACWTVLRLLGALCLGPPRAGVDLGPWLELERHLGVLLASWTTTAVCLCVALTGRSRFLLSLMFGLPLAILGMSLLANVSPWPHTLRQAMLATSGLAVAATTLGLFEAARRRGFVSGSQCVTAGVVWIALCATLWMGVRSLLDNGWQTPNLILLWGVASLAVAPLAAGPLAAAWNRHR